MKSIRQALPLLLCGALGACGGGTSNDSGKAVISVNFTPPLLNEQRVYGQVAQDSSSNTINRSWRTTVTELNADGSYQSVQDDPSNNSIVVNGVNFSIHHMVMHNDVNGHTLSEVIDLASGQTETCSYGPHGGGATFPLVPGAHWQTSYTSTCSLSAPGAPVLEPVAVTQTGSVMGTESISVPAGVFNTIRVDSTSVATTSNAVNTQTVSNWRDVSNGRVVRTVVSYAFSGALPLHDHIVSETTELQSAR